MQKFRGHLSDYVRDDDDLLNYTEVGCWIRLVEFHLREPE